jgi:hypothetical protein
MKTNELTGAALDWAVMQCRGLVWALHGRVPFSTDWAQGGPIIEREKITIEWTGEDWMGYIRHDEEFFGPTPLIAAMRCYVASVLGNEVEIPATILETV